MEQAKKNKWSLALSNALFENSFLAPFKGFQYFVNDDQLWQPLLAICVPSAIVSILVLTALAVTVFPPYVFVVVMVTGPLGLISAIITLLVVSRRITVIISHFLFMRHIQAAIFDRVLKKEGAFEVVARYEAMKNRHMPKKSLEARLYYQTLPFVAREIFYILLGIVPLIGPFIVLMVKAPIKGYKAHKRYYKLMMWDYRQINRFYKEYHPDYTAFGFIALLLEMIPGLTICFMFTNNIGIALWTAKFHKDFEEFMREEVDKPDTKGEEMEFWSSVIQNETEAAEVPQAP